MFEVMITGAFAVFGGVVIYGIKKSSTKFHKDAQVVMTVIDRFKELNELDAFDVTLVDPKEYSDTYKSHMKRFDNNSLANESVIGREIKKGYDLIHVHVRKGFFTPFHIHRNSEEFVYVLKGSLNVFFCENGFEMNVDKVESTSQLQEPRDSVKVSEGEYIMLRNNESHSVSSTEDSEFIIIALPPLEKILQS